MRNPFSKRELRRVERAAAKLPRIEREVLRLSAREKLDYYQIGEQLDLSVKQVEQHLPIRISQEFAGENRIARAATLEVPSCDRARERGAIGRGKAECGSTVECRLRLPDRIRQPRQLDADPLDLIGVDDVARAHAGIPNPGSLRSGGRAAWGATRRFRARSTNAPRKCRRPAPEDATAPSGGEGR